jgi:SPP1 gp7 family putative phage head morphogenesis protein
VLERVRSWFKAPDPQVVRAMPTGEVAWSESRMYGADDFPKYNPDSLIGTRGFGIYKKMMLDEQVKAVVQFKRDAVTSRGYYFELESEALGEDETERRIKVFEQAVKKLRGSFTMALNKIMSARYNGFSLVEKVYDQQPLIEVDGKTYIIIQDLKLRPFDTFEFYVDVYGNVEKVVQRIDNINLDIDLSRFIHYVCQPDVDPHYGQSDLREAYRAWYSKDHAIKFRNIFLERMAGGLVTIEPEKGVTITRGSQAHTDLMNILSNLQTKTGILLPAGMKMTVNYPSGKNENYEAAIASDNKAIAKSLLVPNLLGISEQGAHGSFAQSETQLEAFLWTLDNIAETLAETLNEQLFPELGDLNFGDGVYPRFCFHPLSETMKLRIIGTWKELVTSGAVEPSDTDEQHLRDLLEFPDKGEPIKKPLPLGQIDPRTGLPMKPPGFGNQPPQPEAEGAPEDEEKQTQYARLQRATRRVDFAVIERKSTAIESTTLNKLGDTMKDIASDLQEQIKTTGLAPALADELKVKSSLVTRIRKAVYESLRDGWNLGQEHARREVEKALASEAPEVKRLSRDKMVFAAQSLTEAAAQLFLEQRSYQVAGDVAENLRKRVVTTIFNGIKNSWSLDEVVRRIAEEVDSYSIPQLNTVVRTTTFEAMNEARYNFFSTPELGGFVEALEYSAILDGRTTDLCRELDGRIYPSDSDVWNTYRPPNHFNCRSLLIAVTQLDTWTESEEPGLLPAEGFG